MPDAQTSVRGAPKPRLWQLMEHFEPCDIRLPLVPILKNPNPAPAGANFHVLSAASPLKWRQAAERLACYFRREFQYDFPPYRATEEDGDDEVSRDRVLIFGRNTWSRTGAVGIFFFGAVGVRWVEDEDDAPPCWSLEWAWFHPYERGKGHLSRAWPHLLQLFPDPSLAHPLSKAMIEFLRKAGYATPLEKPESDFRR